MTNGEPTRRQESADVAGAPLPAVRIIAAQTPAPRPAFSSPADTHRHASRLAGQAPARRLAAEGSAGSVPAIGALVAMGLAIVLVGALACSAFDSAEPASDAPAQSPNGAASTPQTVDSPEAAAGPAPPVVEVVPSDTAGTPVDQGADSTGDQVPGTPATEAGDEAGTGATDAGDSPPGAGSDSAATPAPGLSADTESRLGALIAELGEVAGTWNPTGRAALAVATPDGRVFGLNEHQQRLSASAVKVIWVAAAIYLAGLEAVESFAEATLVQSDNWAAGDVIDLIGIDTVNDWSRDPGGLTATHLAAWYFGNDRMAESVRAGGSRANLTTAADLALFYARLQRGELLDADGYAALAGWLRATPRRTAPTAVDSALLARLPAEVAAAAIHKAGWFPPYCCASEVRLIIDAGVIPLPGGSWFAIAAISDRGEAYNLSVRWVALAACRVYALLAEDARPANAARTADDSPPPAESTPSAPHSCDRDGDGIPRPELWPPPPAPPPEPPPPAPPPPAPEEQLEPAEQPPPADNAAEPDG